MKDSSETRSGASNSGSELIARMQTPGAWIRSLMAHGLKPAGPIRVVEMPRKQAQPQKGA